MSNHKIPWDELSGESNLNGTYKVTFLLDVTENDELSISDLHETIASGFSGDKVLNKISRLDLEKTDKQGNVINLSGNFKVGDSVVIKEDIEMEAELEYHEGNYIVGAKGLETEKLGKVHIFIPQGFKAKINQVANNEVELIDFDTAISVPLKNSDTGQIEDVFVNLDSVIFSNKYIEHLED